MRQAWKERTCVGCIPWAECRSRVLFKPQSALAVVHLCIQILNSQARNQSEADSKLVRVMSFLFVNGDVYTGNGKLFPKASWPCTCVYSSGTHDAYKQCHGQWQEDQKHGYVVFFLAAAIGVFFGMLHRCDALRGPSLSLLLFVTLLPPPFRRRGLVFACAPPKKNQGPDNPRTGKKERKKKQKKGGLRWVSVVDLVSKLNSNMSGVFPLLENIPFDRGRSGTW